MLDAYPASSEVAQIVENRPKETMNKTCNTGCQSLHVRSMIDLIKLVKQARSKALSEIHVDRVGAS